MIRRPSRGSAACVQASYYLTTGLWPLVSPRTFQSLTGPKRDFWLAQTAGALIAVIGVSIGSAARNERLVDTATVRTLALGAAVSLAAVDIVFVGRRRISSVYLADAAAELAIVAAWLASRSSSRVGGGRIDENRASESREGST